MSGTDDILVRLGDAGGIETTGCYSGSRDITPVTNGFIVFVGNSLRTATGHMDIVKSWFYQPVVFYPQCIYVYNQ